MPSRHIHARGLFKMSSIKKKLACRKGFTLSEMLVTAVIMLLVGAAITAGVATAAKVFVEGTKISEANILCGTLATELADEMRFAENADAESGVFTFSSRRFGSGVRVINDNGYIYIGDGSSKKLLLGEKAYTSGLQAEASVSPVAGDSLVEINIKAKKEGETVAETNITVSVLSLEE